MWRCVLAVILLPTLTAAQTTALNGPQTPEFNQQRQPTARPMYNSFTFYNQIRCGTAEDVAIELTDNFFVALPNLPQPGIQPIKLELEPQQGFTFGPVRYPKAQKQQSKFPSGIFNLSRANSTPIQFKLRAAKDIALGTHTVHGRLTFQEIGETGIGLLRAVDIEVPVTVVERNVRVREVTYPHASLTRGQIALLILLAPLLILLLIPMSIVCTGGQSDMCM